jgi:stearoyl-CoA desaturase (Delta-9 desaturase)
MTETQQSTQMNLLLESERQPSIWQIFISWGTVIIGITLPIAGLIAAATLAWRYGWLGWIDLGLLACVYLVTMTGLTVGFHRLFTHRSFETTHSIQFLLGVLGSMTFQGRLVEWVGRHRLHHQHSDNEGDPHSPHAPRRTGFWGRFRAFWHAHIGWAFAHESLDLDRYAPDLQKSRMLRMVSGLFHFWAVLGLLIPAAIGYVFGGWPGSLTGFLWGGLIRVLIGHHATWSVNSICHLWGRQPYVSKDESRNNAFVGILTLGEGWHNNHHAYPTSAQFGHRWWQADPGYLFIRLLASLGLAWNVKMPTETVGNQVSQS